MTDRRQAPTWQKSSYSSETENCVEVALAPQATWMRDTKARQQGHLEVSAQAWRALVERL